MPTGLESDGHFKRELNIQNRIDSYFKIATSSKEPQELAVEVVPAARNLHALILNIYLERILRIITKIPLFTNNFRQKVVKLLDVNVEQSSS